VILNAAVLHGCSITDLHEAMWASCLYNGRWVWGIGAVLNGRGKLKCLEKNLSQVLPCLLQNQNGWCRDWTCACVVRSGLMLC